MGIKRMEDELKKGRFLCCKCHEKETRDENKVIREEFEKNCEHKVSPGSLATIKANREYIDSKKMEIEKCVTCGEKAEPDLLSYMHFDHINPEKSLIDSQCFEVRNYREK